jgi:hypothetical protein
VEHGRERLGWGEGGVVISVSAAKSRKEEKPWHINKAGIGTHSPTRSTSIGEAPENRPFSGRDLKSGRIYFHTLPYVKNSGDFSFRFLV